MPICTNIDSNGFLIATNTPLLDCQTNILLTKHDYENLTSFDIASLLNSSDLLFVYSWGVGAVLTLWVIGFTLSVALGMLKKI